MILISIKLFRPKSEFLLIKFIEKVELHCFFTTKNITHVSFHWPSGQLDHTNVCNKIGVLCLFNYIILKIVHPEQ